MTRREKTSIILRRAADRHLSTGDFYTAEKDGFSCGAVQIACEPDWNRSDEVILFLGELGCPTYSASAFDDIPAGIECQSARHAWLYLTALVAEDEGD